jgi:hypothetical protein
MTINYRVDVAGDTVWSSSTEGDDADFDIFPAEWLERPAEPAEGDPFPAAHELFIGETMIGRQISFAEEAAQ